jgi:hypothetical protein
MTTASNRLNPGPDWFTNWTRLLPQPWGTSTPDTSGNPLSAFVQPILPGWVTGNVINVTEENSASPQTEQDIVAKVSYGRQIGTLIDALVALIEERQPTGGTLPDALSKLLALHTQVEDIKRLSVTDRVKRIESDLAFLKQTSEADYKKVLSQFKAAK